MRTSLVLSLIFHGLVLMAALVSFRAHEKLDPPRRVSVEVVTPSEVSTVKAGKPDQKKDEAAMRPAPADKTSNVVQTAAELRPSPSDTISQKLAALPPPKPKALPPQEAKEKPDREPQPKAPAKTSHEEKAASALPPAKHAEVRKPRKPISHHEQPRAAKGQDRHENEPKPKPARSDDRIADLLDRPTPPVQGESKFDPKQIAALLNRDPTAGARPEQDGPREPWRKPSSLQDQAQGMAPDAPPREAYGDPAGRDPRMSANEIDAFRAQISRCWTPPVGGLGGDPIIVKLRIVLNEDGTLGVPPEVLNTYGSPFFRPAADSAVRAVVQCQPYRMPAEKFSQWRDMLLTFDPSRMYGG
ncbi:MAG: cell envelope integrity protein TolA [Rhodomicrobiaceae bacterium]